MFISATKHNEQLFQACLHRQAYLPTALHCKPNKAMPEQLVAPYDYRYRYLCISWPP